MGKKKERKVSIVMLTRDNLSYTKQCVEKIEETTEGYELIIVDNGSTDGTVEYLKKLSNERKNVKVAFNKSNKGFAAGCNQGVRMARYNLICLLNNDIVPFPGWLDKMKEAFEKGVGIVGAKLIFPDETLQHCGIVFEYREQPQPHFWPFHRFFGWPMEIEEANYLEEVPAVTAACLLTNKMIWNDVGGMDEGYVLANFEDVDFNLKVRERGHKILYQPEAVLIHYWGTTVRKVGEERAQEFQMNYQLNFQRLMMKWYQKIAQGLVPVIGAPLPQANIPV